MVFSKWGLLIVFGLLALVLVAPLFSRSDFDAVDPSIPKARNISSVLSLYAQDHQGSFPAGQSSTEIFQKLIDEGYANDQSLFYLPIPGKVLPVSRNRLKSENIGFDVTSRVDPNDSDTLPVVFTTGYRVNYKGRCPAMPMFPVFRSWHGWWQDEPDPLVCIDIGIAVARKDCSAERVKFLPDRSVPLLISQTQFDAHGKTYRQLTPDGPLPDMGK